jgi:hypothetical protein
VWHLEEFKRAIDTLGHGILRVPAAQERDVFRPAVELREPRREEVGVKQLVTVGRVVAEADESEFGFHADVCLILPRPGVCDVGLRLNSKRSDAGMLNGQALGRCQGCRVLGVAGCWQRRYGEAAASGT